jgi:hypothetical protein
VLANPPQRPSKNLDAVEPDQRHLHEGGGADGLDALRLLLNHVTAPRLTTTVSSVLDLTRAVNRAGWSRWSARLSRYLPIRRGDLRMTLAKYVSSTSNRARPSDDSTVVVPVHRSDLASGAALAAWRASGAPPYQRFLTARPLFFGPAAEPSRSRGHILDTTGRHSLSAGPALFTQVASISGLSARSLALGQAHDS